MVSSIIELKYLILCRLIPVDLEPTFDPRMIANACVKTTPVKDDPWSALELRECRFEGARGEVVNLEVHDEWGKTATCAAQMCFFRPELPSLFRGTLGNREGVTLSPTNAGLPTEEPGFVPYIFGIAKCQ